MKSSLHVGLNLIHFGACAMVIDLKFFLKFKKARYLCSSFSPVTESACEWLGAQVDATPHLLAGSPLLGQVSQLSRRQCGRCGWDLGCVLCGGVLHAHLWPSPHMWGLLVVCSQVFI